MMSPILCRCLRLTCFVALAVLCAAESQGQQPPLIPSPKTLQPVDGRLTLKSPCQIVASDESLIPAANVAGDEIAALFGLKCRIARHDDSAGAIVLQIDRSLKAEEYQIEVSDGVVVKGGDYKGVVWGLVTLLQSAGADNGQLVLPRMKVADKPDSEYRGLLIDTARRWHPIESLKEVVVLCHWYKIGFLQLHLSDHESWTFPSTAYPQLATPGRHYTLKELRELESFAAAHGVTVVTSLDMPGHCGSLLKALPAQVADNPPVPTTGAICPGQESTYKVVETLVGEVCDVFRSTPYYHIGGDEVDKSAWKSCKNCAAYRRQHGIDDEEELYRHFLVRMNDIVKRQGKRTIAWEGFKVAGKIEIPKDITVMEFESHYELPQNYVAAGYKVINTAWQPLYVVNDRAWSPEKILSWNVYRWEHFAPMSAAYEKGIDVPPSPLVIGAQMCSWEQLPEIEIPSLRQRAAAMSQRIWDHRTPPAFTDFSKSLQQTDAGLTKLLPTATTPR